MSVMQKVIQHCTDSGNIAEQFAPGPQQSEVHARLRGCNLQRQRLPDQPPQSLYC